MTQNGVNWNWEDENCESLQGAADLDLESCYLDVLMQAEEGVGVLPAYEWRTGFFSFFFFYMVERENPLGDALLLIKTLFGNEEVGWGCRRKVSRWSQPTGPGQNNQG